MYTERRHSKREKGAPLRHTDSDSLEEMQRLPSCIADQLHSDFKGDSCDAPDTLLCRNGNPRMGGKRPLILFSSRSLPSHARLLCTLGRICFPVCLRRSRDVLDKESS